MFCLHELVSHYPHYEPPSPCSYSLMLYHLSHTRWVYKPLSIGFQEENWSVYYNKFQTALSLKKKGSDKLNMHFHIVLPVHIIQNDQIYCVNQSIPNTPTPLKQIASH